MILTGLTHWSKIYDSHCNIYDVCAPIDELKQVPHYAGFCFPASLPTVLILYFVATMLGPPI